MHSRTWPVLLCRRLCTVTQGPVGPLHHQYFVCGAALLGAVHCTAPWVPCRTALVGSGQWAVELLQCTATLPGGNGQCGSCNALPHCLWAVGVELLFAPPHCLGVVGGGTPAMHCLTAWGQWGVELLQCTASLRGSGQRNPRNALPHCLGAVGGGTPAITATPPEGGG